MEAIVSRDIHNLIADIDALAALDISGCARLESLIDEYFASPVAVDHLDVWFRLYERFPDDDTHGGFWSILHGLEAQPGCDAAVVVSVCRKPTFFPLMMVNRMLNGNITTAAGTDLLGLLRRVAADEQASATVRQEAQRFLEHQRGRA
jgi:hypothetical protein